MLICQSTNTFQPRKQPFKKGALGGSKRQNGAPALCGRSAPPVSPLAKLGLKPKQPSGVLPSTIRRRSKSATGLWTVRALLIAGRIVDHVSEHTSRDRCGISCGSEARLRSMRDQPLRRRKCLPRVDNTPHTDPRVAGSACRHVGTSPPQDRLGVSQSPELVELLQCTDVHRIGIAGHAMNLLKARRECRPFLLKRAVACPVLVPPDPRGVDFFLLFLFSSSCEG